MEEKTNRIVEVIVSSVKPFQLLMGKIIGVAMVGLTQFLLWVILSLTITGILNATVFKDMVAEAKFHQEQVKEIEKKGIEFSKKELKPLKQPMELFKEREALAKIDFGKILFCFGFYFLAGYLLFGAMYAAIGSAVDAETDTQQFMLPVTLPIIVSFIFAQYVAMNPHSTLSVWLSIIPFTSPVTMMVRIPFDPPAWQLAISMISLVIGFLFTTWLASRIYRTGILMYGKKVSWREIGKWLFYKG
jgi:ABC-2 type transport system permease protein